MPKHQGCGSVTIIKDRHDTDFLGYNIIVTGVHSMQL